MARAVFTYPKPTPSGVTLNLTVKEALTLRNFCLRATKLTDPDGTVRQIIDALSTDEIFGPSIG